MLHAVGKWRITNGLKPQPEQSYAHRVIQRVNKEEEEAEGQKRRTSTGMINVLGLIHKKENKSDPRLAWFISHQIYHIVISITNKK